jgi:hypothetical protein
MATLSIPRSVRPSGKVHVREAPAEVERFIEDARRAARQIVVLHEIMPAGNDQEFRIKWSLCQAIELDPDPDQRDPDPAATA